MVVTSTYDAIIVTTAKTTSLTSGPAIPLSWPVTMPPPLRGRPLRSSLAGARCDAHSSEHHALPAKDRRQGRGGEVGDVAGLGARLVGQDAADEVQLGERAGQDVRHGRSRLTVAGDVLRIPAVVGSTPVARRFGTLGTLRGFDAVVRRIGAVV